jgi:hypothetical protein
MLCDSHRFGDLYQRDVPGGHRLRRMHGPSGDVELGVANEMKPTATWTGSWTELQAPGAHGVHGVPRWRCRRARMDRVSSGEPMSGAFVTSLGAGLACRASKDVGPLSTVDGLSSDLSLNDQYIQRRMSTMRAVVPP